MPVGYRIDVKPVPDAVVNDVAPFIVTPPMKVELEPPPAPKKATCVPLFE